MSYSYGKGWNWILVIFGILLFLVLIAILPPYSFSRQGSARNEALNNAKGIAQGLIDFKNEYGAYPCEFTREEFESNGYKNLPVGNSANAYLAQLMASGSIDSETFFYVSSESGYFKGDDEIDSPEKLLAKGENGFSYVMTKDGEPLTDTRSKTPLVLAPLIRGGEDPAFDPDILNGYYVYGSADGSGLHGKIDDEGRALTNDGTYLFAIGPDSHFGDDIPVVKLPR